jgi:hypothetical protein
VARAVQFSVLKTRVRQRTNTENQTGFIADAELGDLINESVAELYDLLRSTYGQDYFLSTQSFQTVANQSDYPLPSDFLTARGVDVTFGQNIIITARPYVWSERNRYKWYPGWIYSQPVFYRIVGNVLRFIPTPSGSYSITLNYVPTPTLLVNAGDTFDGIAGWEEYAVLDAAIKCLLKSEQLELAGTYEGRKQQMKLRIRSMAGNRDAENPERIQDVSLNDGWVGRPGY